MFSTLFDRLLQSLVGLLLNVFQLATGIPGSAKYARLIHLFAPDPVLGIQGYFSLGSLRQVEHEGDRFLDVLICALQV